MFFVKKLLLGFGAFFLILLGGAGTQSQSMLLQGGGFLGLIIGLVVLYIFAKMAWRAMGCLPSLLVFVVITVFVLYAIGAFRGGIGNITQNVKSFLGQSTVSDKSDMASPQIMLFEEDNVAPISENFSSSTPDQQPKKSSSGGVLDKLFNQENKPSDFNPSNYPAIYSQARVVSGDTLILAGGRYLRLFGVDAPESNQTCSDGYGKAYRCGQQAAAWLSSWIQDNELECRVIQQNEQGNIIGTCSLGAYDIGAALINAGWAVVYKQHTDIYSPYQVQAQTNRRGLWQGKFYMPWDWRKIQARKPKIKIINKPKKRRHSFFGF